MTLRDPTPRMHALLRVLAFFPAALLPAVASAGLVSLQGGIVGIDQAVAHALLWPPALLVALGAVLAWRGTRIRWVLVPLCGLSVLEGVGIGIENWQFFAEEPLALLWTCWLLGAPLLVWLLPGHAV